MARATFITLLAAALLLSTVEIAYQVQFRRAARRLLDDLETAHPGPTSELEILRFGKPAGELSTRFVEDAMESVRARAGFPSRLDYDFEESRVLHAYLCVSVLPPVRREDGSRAWAHRFLWSPRTRSFHSLWGPDCSAPGCPASPPAR